MKTRQKAPRWQLDVAEAAEHLAQGRVDEAEARCRRVLETSPRCGSAYHLLGVVLAQRGDAQGAIASLERAVGYSPLDMEAWSNLGRLTLTSDPPRSEACFRHVVERIPYSVEARGNLATLLFQRGDYDEAEVHLRAILSVLPEEPEALRLLARVKRLKGEFQEEVSIVRGLLKREPKNADLREILRETYFLWYDSVDNQPEVAIRVLKEWLEFDPKAEVARHMLASLTGQDVPNRASPEYVERHFDAFAATFDQVLTSLSYCGPDVMGDLLARWVSEKEPVLAILDLGCGTGRLGPIVQPWKKSLVGLDLSSKALDIARQNGGYDELVHADALAFLPTRPLAFNLVACVDTLVYFGQLEPLFRQVRCALQGGGRFMGTFEVLDEEEADNVRLHQGGRYAHKASWVQALLEKTGFRVDELKVIEQLRREGHKPVRAVGFMAHRLD